MRRTGDGVRHQRGHDHQGVCGVFLLVHDRPIRGRDAYESSRTALAFRFLKRNIVSSEDITTLRPVDI